MIRPDFPQTTAERTNYSETSSHADVLEFLRALEDSGAPIRVSVIGRSPKGRSIPLVVAGRTSPASRPVVYIQANIHGGEVEGKEAILMLLRDLCRRDPEKILEKLTLVIAPIYNADGNDAWGENRRNRPSQDGPERIGERANGDGLDLNRDCVKAKSPEMRAVLKSVWNTWNPDVVMDLHTTNGTRHAYPLTFSPSLAPNTDPEITKYTRDSLLADVKKSLAREKLPLFDYGDIEESEMGGRREVSWRTFGDEARYVTNYAGVRGKISILSEAASFQPFATRVDATYRFVNALLTRLARDSKRVVSLTRAAESRAWAGESLGVRFAPISRGIEPVVVEKLSAGERVADHRKAPTRFETLTVPVYDRFSPTLSATVPDAYAIAPGARELIALLRRHGLAMRRLEPLWKGEVERFRITRKTIAAAPFQGVRLTRLDGEFSRGVEPVEPGTLIMPTKQALGVLAFHLLEPQGLDGASAWGALEIDGDDYPIRKLYYERGERP